MTTTLTLYPPTLADAERARQWRNDPRVRSMLRTPTPLSMAQQQAFHASLEAPGADRRYWAAYEGDRSAARMVALAGLTGIQWENGLAEISLVVDPGHPNLCHGGGRAPVTSVMSGGGTDLAVGGLWRMVTDAVLTEAFERMRLLTVFGECYECSRYVDVWTAVVGATKGESLWLPRRKWWDGRLYGALYFWWTAPGP